MTSVPVVNVRRSAPETTVSRIVALVTMFLLVGSFYYVPLVVLWALYQAIVHHSVVAIAVLVVLVGSTFYPSQLLWQAFIDSYVWECWRRYFQFTVIREGEFDAKEHYVFAEHPHAIMPVGFMLSATIVQQELAAIRVEGAIATVLFYIPILQHLCRWFGSRPATPSNVRRLLQAGSVGLLPGGIAELFLCDPDRECVYLKHRKGFIKMAIEHGASLVPVYYLGNTQLFSKIGGGVLARVSRSLRASFVLFYGRFFLPIPYAHPITMLVGKPIKVAKVEQPTKEQIDAVHATFVAELEALFERHKTDFGWSSKKLEIV